MDDAFQIAHKEWLDREYPNQPVTVPAAGMVEEAGELMHALLKQTQQNIWGEEPRYSREHWGRKILDAVGDCAIYACSLCNAAGWNYRQLVQQASSMPAKARPAFVAVADLVAAGVRVVQEPSELAAMDYLRILMYICNEWNVDFTDAVAVAWAKVSRRTRNAKPAPEIVCLCGSTRFKQEFIQANFDFTMRGCIVLSVGWFSHTDGAIFTPTPEQKAALDELHLRKIDRANRVFVLNGKAQRCAKCKTFLWASQCRCSPLELEYAPYIGESTRREIAYAEANGKPVEYLNAIEPEEERAQQVVGSDAGSAQE